jgi:hypothetical protein
MRQCWSLIQYQFFKGKRLSCLGSALSLYRGGLELIRLLDPALCSSPLDSTKQVSIRVCSFISFFGQTRIDILSRGKLKQPSEISDASRKPGPDSEGLK